MKTFGDVQSYVSRACTPEEDEGIDKLLSQWANDSIKLEADRISNKESCTREESKRTKEAKRTQENKEISLLKKENDKLRMQVGDLTTAQNKAHEKALNALQVIE